MSWLNHSYPIIYTFTSETEDYIHQMNLFSPQGKNFVPLCQYSSKNFSCQNNLTANIKIKSICNDLSYGPLKTHVISCCQPQDHSAQNPNTSSWSGFQCNIGSLTFLIIPQQLINSFHRPYHALITKWQELRKLFLLQRPLPAMNVPKPLRKSLLLHNTRGPGTFPKA